MRAEELVSIIIPTLNEEENIERVIKSIMIQDYRPLEVIIVDGGSKDGTLEIVERIKREASSESFMIRVLTEHGECRSPANAKNIGFASARGAYVLFIDADYVLLDHDFISKVVKALEGSPWVSVRLIPTKGKNNLISLAQVAMNRAWAPKGYVDERRCFKREFLESNAKPPFDPCLGVGEDAHLIHRLRSKGFKPMFVDVRLGEVVPSNLRRFVRRYEWYGRTALRFYAKVHKFSRLKALVNALWDNKGVWITIIYPVLFTLLYLWLGSVGLFIGVGLYASLRIRFFIKVPVKSLRILMAVSLLDMVRSASYLMGLLKGFIGLCAKVSRD
jgi:glycosyltransferase involved in cell wall biosynthesis